jgi:hypothetical protein
MGFPPRRFFDHIIKKSKLPRHRGHREHRVIKTENRKRSFYNSGCPCPLGEESILF